MRDSYIIGDPFFLLNVDLEIISKALLEKHKKSSTGFNLFTTNTVC